MSGLYGAPLEADLFLIATPDRAIPGVARQLARLGGKFLQGKIALHTSGALTSAALRPLARCGARVGSMHPLQTFSRGVGTALEGVVFGVEGDRVARRQAARIVRDLGGVPVEIPTRPKALYHAAATLACGRLLALVDGAARLFVRAGMKRGQARRAILPLVRQTLENFEGSGGRAAWTGPLERGDLSTLRLHAHALSRVEPEMREAYRALGELALRLYRPRERELARVFRRLFRG